MPCTGDSTIDSSSPGECMCVAGYQPSNSNCEQCPAGLYKNTDGNYACAVCPPLGTGGYCTNVGTVMGNHLFFAEQNKTKQNKTRQSKTKQNITEQNKTKQNNNVIFRSEGATRCNKEHHPEQNTRRNNEKSSQFRLWRKVQLLFGISDHSKARRTSCTQGVGAHK